MNRETRKKQGAGSLIPEVAKTLDRLHTELKETLRMQIALEQTLKAQDCKGPQILADIIKVRLGTMDLCLTFLQDLRNEIVAGKGATCQTSTGPYHRCVTQDNEIIDADLYAGGA